MLWTKQTPEGVVFKAFIQPKASRNEIAGLKEDALKIRLTAPPVEGAANSQLTQFLAKSLKVRKSDVVILRGKTSRSKQVLVRSATTEKIESLLKV
jgi:uncharacterized protein (TIGR00251 family)